jgi:hypothetical protein
MKVAQLIVAAAIAIPAVSSFAQSTPPSVNDNVGVAGVTIAQETTTHRYADSADQLQATVNEFNRTEVPPRQLAEMNLGRYSLSVTRPSF